MEMAAEKINMLEFILGFSHTILMVILSASIVLL